MQLAPYASCDVLVIGSGIAGISAALRAAETGARVILACAGPLFSGSSFYPGTWGLGLIGPTDAHDESDLAHTIETVGGHMTDPALVSAFVSGIQPAIQRVRNLGVQLKTAQHATENEFIPCFDHAHRSWNGLEFASVQQVYSQALARHHVTILPHHEVIELMSLPNVGIAGAVCLYTDSTHDPVLRAITASATVLATGGYGNLFTNHLCTSDVSGVGQGLALQAGCTLVNMEFMQVMLGYLNPAPKTIFNEKTFRYARLAHPDNTPLFDSHDATMNQALAEHATHGPFTSRLASRAIDLAIHTAYLHDKRGVTVTYDPRMSDDPPEFITTYFDWLATAKGLTMHDPIHIAPFAHAANGGIWIKPDTSTGVAGLFAAGEGTGGMHGADRIGGLSTANGLVFGTKAGQSAAQYAMHHSLAALPHYDVDTRSCDNYAELLTRLQHTMTENLMVVRHETGLHKTLQEIDAIRHDITADTEPSAASIAAYKRIQAQLDTAHAITRAAYMRTESRGSHYRSDYPQQDPNQSYVLASTQHNTTRVWQH